MTPGADPFDDIMARLSVGDQTAARVIYERFVDRLVRLAGSKLDRRLGARVDPESVAQSVFESFFVRQRAGQYELHNWGMVFGLLAHITFRKCLNRNRYHRQQKRAGGDTGPVAFEDWQEVSRTQVGPGEEAMVAELLTKSLDGFDADERAVIEAHLDGAASAAVARTVGLSTRTVQRVMERFRKRLQELIDGE